MVLLPCWLKGKIVRLQTDQHGIDVGEYAFICGQPSVSHEECIKCREHDCEYGYGLIKNRKLRNKVLDYVYDASLDDELLLAGFMPYRSLKVVGKGKKGPVYSKPTLDKETAEKLMLFEEQSRAYLGMYRVRLDLFKELLGKVQPLPSRVTLKKKR